MSCKRNYIIIFINHEDVDVKIDANISGRVKDIISNKEFDLENFVIKADEAVAFLM